MYSRFPAYLAEEYNLIYSFLHYQFGLYALVSFHLHFSPEDASTAFYCYCGPNDWTLHLSKHFVSSSSLNACMSSFLGLEGYLVDAGLD